MTMEAQPTNDGSMRFKLGPVEKLIILAVLSGAGTCIYWIVSNVQTLVTQQAVGNQKLTGIENNISDIPALRTEVTKLQGRVERTEKDVQELKDMRDLR